MMDRHSGNENEVTRITEIIQKQVRNRFESPVFAHVLHSANKQVVTEFGFSDVNCLQAAQARFPNDAEINEQFYIKFNRCAAVLRFAA